MSQAGVAVMERFVQGFMAGAIADLHAETLAATRA